MSLPVVPVTVDSSLHFERSPTVLHYISQSDYTCLPLSVAYQPPFLLSRLKSRYPATSCAIGYRLFLKAYHQNPDPRALRGTKEGNEVANLGCATSQLASMFHTLPILLRVTDFGGPMY